MEKESHGKRPYEVLPPDETVVWRYISLPKLVSLLQTRSLFLSRADLFDDVFEGSFTEGSLREYVSEWGPDFAQRVATLSRWVPSRSYVSCWHISAVESVALWKMYADAEGSIALKSSVGALRSAFPDRADRQEHLIVSQDVRRVVYIDYRSEHPYINDLAGPLCYKRQAFAFEQEVRVIRQELPIGPSSARPQGSAIQLATPPSDRGRELPVELDRLLEAIYLAPSSPDWMLGTIEAVVARFGLEGIECRQSSLDDLPAIGRLEGGEKD